MSLDSTSPDCSFEWLCPMSARRRYRAPAVAILAVMAFVACSCSRDPGRAAGRGEIRSGVRSDSLSFIFYGDSSSDLPLKSTGLFVAPCNTTEPKEWEIWLAQGNEDPRLDTVRYGIAPSGYQTTVQARPLRAGCYHVTTYGRMVDLSFDVDSSGRVIQRR